MLLRIFFIWLMCLTLPLYTQDAGKQFIYLDDWTYDLLEYWINNGKFSQSYVLNQPYTISALEKNCTADNNWSRFQKKYYQRYFGQQGYGKLILYGRDNYAFISKSEPDLPKRKGLAQAPMDDIYLYDNKTRNFYNFSAQFNLTMPHLALVNRTVINSEFKDDPLFFGDKGEWIFGRANDAFINANAGPFDIFFGRMDRNWGALASPGLILSDNPYSYDHAQLSYTADKVKFSLIVTRLEDLTGFSTEGLYPDSLFLARKFFTAHRIDFNLSSRLQMAFSEVAVYGGPDRDFEFGFLNPMNYFYLVQRNNHVEISGLWAFDLFSKPSLQTNFFLQFLLDDVVINNEPGQDDRAQYPDRFGITLKFSEADLLLAGLQTGIEYTRIGNRTYQSFRTWENFHYHEKGLGYPGSSVEAIKLTAKYFNLFPAIIQFSGGYQRSGNTLFTDVFPGEKEKFPVGIVEKKCELNLKLTYFPNTWSRFTMSLGYENIKNYNNNPALSISNVKVVLGVHLNYFLQMKFM